MTCSGNPYNAEKEAVEKAIYECSMHLYDMQPPVNIAFNRDSVCMADDMQSHAGTFSMAPTARVAELLREALETCSLASGGSKATWSISTVDANWRHKRSIGVQATQWSEPKLVVSPDETVASLFKDGAVGLYFGYRAQSDADADFKSLSETGRYPAPIVARSEILAEIRRIKAGIPPIEPGADARHLHRERLQALLLLVQMEIEILRQIDGAQVYADKLAAMVPEMTGDLTRLDPKDVIDTAHRWGDKLCAIYRLVDARFPAHPRSGDKNSRIRDLCARE